MGKFLFSIAVHAKDEAAAIKKFQEENIYPGDMDIENLIDEDENNKYTVVGFYADTKQKYTGEHFARYSAEVEKQAEKLGVTVCGVFLGSITALDNSPTID